MNLLGHGAQRGGAHGAPRDPGSSARPAQVREHFVVFELPRETSGVAEDLPRSAFEASGES